MYISLQFVYLIMQTSFLNFFVITKVILGFSKMLGFPFMI